MASVAILASGSGSNFQVITQAILASGRHSVAILVYDRKDAYVAQRAKDLGVPSYYVKYPGRSREDAEEEIITVIKKSRADLVVLAGFMRLFTPKFIGAFPDKIINIHPALLPSHPGAHGIADSFKSPDKKLGITIHYVDCGMDTGQVIEQASFERNGKETLEEIEKKIHNLEHATYPRVILGILDKIQEQRQGA